MSRSRMLSQALGLAVAVAAVGFAAAPQASAAPAAAVDQLIRPCFGVLTEPNIKDCKRGGRWSGRGHDRYDGAGVVRVRCDAAGPNARPISAAIARAKAGSVIRVYSVDRPCTETVSVTKSVWIQSDAGADRVSGATLRAPKGRPCVEIARGVRDVKISGFSIDAEEAQGADCITAHDTDLLITDTRVRYVGEGSALKVTGGRLRFGMGSSIRARSGAAAVSVEDALLEIDDASVTASFVGVDVVPGPGVNLITGLRLRALNDRFIDATAGPSTGLAVRASSDGWLRVEDSFICGYSTGAFVDPGAAAAFLGGKVCRSEVGFVNERGRLRVQGVDVGAADTGVLASGGVTELFKTHIYGVARAGVYNDNEAKLWSDGNKMYPYGKTCDQLGGGVLTSGLLCGAADELPDFYLAERDPRAGRFDDDGRDFRVDPRRDPRELKSGYGWSDDWGSRGAGKDRSRDRW